MLAGRDVEATRGALLLIAGVWWSRRPPTLCVSLAAASSPACRHVHPVFLTCVAGVQATTKCVCRRRSGFVVSQAIARADTYRI